MGGAVPLRSVKADDCGGAGACLQLYAVPECDGVGRRLERMVNARRQGSLPRLGGVLETCVQSAVDRAIQRWHLGAAQCYLRGLQN